MSIKFTYENNDYMITDDWRGYEYHYRDDPKRPYDLVERTDYVISRYWEKVDEEIASTQELQETYDDFLHGTGRW